MIDNDYETVFIVDNFDGSIFQQLQRAGCRIFAPAVILRCAMYGEVRVVFVCFWLVMLQTALKPPVFLYLLFVNWNTTVFLTVNNVE